jgi:hypothetical protein
MFGTVNATYARMPEITVTHVSVFKIRQRDSEITDDASGSAFVGVLLDRLEVGKRLRVFHLHRDGQDLITSPVVRFHAEGAVTYLETTNSVYKIVDLSWM